MIFMSGLQYPMTVVDRLYESIKEDKKKIELDLQFNSNVIFKDDYIIPTKTKQETQELSAREKLLKLIR